MCIFQKEAASAGEKNIRDEFEAIVAHRRHWADMLAA